MLSVEVGGNHRYWAATESDTLENEFIDHNCQHFLKLGEQARTFNIECLNYDENEELPEDEKVNIIFKNEINTFRLRLYREFDTDFVRKDIADVPEMNYAMYYTEVGKTTQGFTDEFGVGHSSEVSVYGFRPTDTDANIIPITNEEFIEDFDINNELLNNLVNDNNNSSRVFEFHGETDRGYDNRTLFTIQNKLRNPTPCLIFHWDHLEIIEDTNYHYYWDYSKANITVELGWVWGVKEDWWWGPWNIFHHYYEWYRKTIYKRSNTINTIITYFHEVVGTWDYSLENKWYYYYPANYNRFKVYYKIKYHLTPAKVVIKQKIMSTRSGLILERS